MEPSARFWVEHACSGTGRSGEIAAVGLPGLRTEESMRPGGVTARSRCHLAWMMGWDFQTMTSEFPEIAARIDAKVAERMSSVPDDDSDAEEE